MSRAKTSIADRLNAAQVAIHNTLVDAEIQTAVAAWGRENNHLIAFGINL